MLLSACNDEMIPDPVDNLGYEIACKTYGSPREATGNLNLARSLVHPESFAQNIGRNFMASHGFRLVNVIR